MGPNRFFYAGARKVDRNIFGEKAIFPARPALDRRKRYIGVPKLFTDSDPIQKLLRCLRRCTWGRINDLLSSFHISPRGRRIVGNNRAAAQDELHLVGEHGYRGRPAE